MLREFHFLVGGEIEPIVFKAGGKCEKGRVRKDKSSLRCIVSIRWTATPARTFYAKVGAEMALAVQIEFQESRIKRFISPAHNLLRPYDLVPTVTSRGPFVTMRRWRSNALSVPDKTYARDKQRSVSLLFIQRNFQQIYRCPR